MKVQNFNQGWVLNHEIGSIMTSVFGSNARPESVDLPHDAMISLPRGADQPSGAGVGYFKGENLEYSKKFFVSADERDKVHYLSFDGVYMFASFWVNGSYVAQQFCGYVPCIMRIDKYLKYGEENTVRVSVRGEYQPEARWYPGLGIYREADMLILNAIHVKPDTLHATTLDCDSELAAVELKAEIFNASAYGNELRARFSVLSTDGKRIAGQTVRFYADAGETVTVRKRLFIENPQLWDDLHPDLYCVSCCLETLDAEVVDEAESFFGIRKLQMDSRHGFRINGREVKLKGGCIHHDNGMLGAVSLPDAELRKVRILKEAGYNAIRTAHNPPSKALLDACDKLGMYVMHEFTDVWTQAKATYDYGAMMPEFWEKDLEAVVRRDYNHPSVIMWSIGNEIPELSDRLGNQWGRKLVEKFKALDNTRFVTNGINVMIAVMPILPDVLKKMAREQNGENAESKEKLDGGVNELMNNLPNLMSSFDTTTAVDEYVEEACDMLDIIGYNYTAGRYEHEHESHPERVFFGSETNPPKLDENWEIVKRNPYVIGDFCWTAWDYLGEVGVGRHVRAEDGGSGLAFMGPYPWICAYCSDIDLTGYRRPISYWRETVWNGREHQPYISVLRPKEYGVTYAPNAYAWTNSIHSWTWPGDEGRMTSVEVYADADEAELFINGKSLGRRIPGDSFKKFYCKWDTEYLPGELVAVTYLDGKEVGRCSLKTAEMPELSVNADKTVLRAGSGDLCYIDIELRDKSGTLDMSTIKRARISVEGDAVLAGSGSADPMTEESYHQVEHAFYEGRMIAIVKAGKRSGTATVTITCEGMENVNLELKIV